MKVFDYLQDKLEKKFKNFSYNVGSTALITIFFKKNDRINYYVLNAGDCRSVINNKHNIGLPLTKDHKPNINEEKQRIEKIGGELEFDGVDWRISGLSVSRSFGDMDALPYVTHKPEIFKYSLKKSDKFMILGCDGLWDVLSNQDAVEFIDNYYNKDITLMSGHSNNNISYQLANHAINKGSYDNVSIIIIFFNK